MPPPSSLSTRQLHTMRASVRDGRNTTGNKPGCLRHPMEESCPPIRLGWCVALGHEKWIPTVPKPFFIWALFIAALYLPSPILQAFPGLQPHASCPLLGLSPELLRIFLNVHAVLGAGPLSFPHGAHTPHGLSSFPKSHSTLTV